MKTLARDRDKAEILERLRALQPTSTRRWGRMSAHQMVCHVSDCCRMLTGQRTVAEAPNRLLPRPVVRWIALYLPLRWPPGIHTTPELDQYGGGTRAVEFAADVAELAALLDEITTGPRRRLNGQRHPVFGRMSEADWLRWAYLHTDHHLRQFGV
jgi:Protein of unknown function (DUF1569)